MYGQQSTSGRADGTPVKPDREYDPVGHALHDEIPAREFYIYDKMVLAQDETLYAWDSFPALFRAQYDNLPLRHKVLSRL
jgi:hypothetical protein